MLISKEYRERYVTIFQQMVELFPEKAFESSVLSYLHYNKAMAWIFWKRIETALEFAEDIHGKNVLDIGCGTGVLFKYLHGNGCTITACDPISRKLAEFSCSKLDISAALYDNLEEIPTREFDYIYVLDVLEHVEDLDTAIEKIITCSHSDTRVIISGPTENFMYKIGRKLAGFSGEYHVRNIYDIEKKLAQNFKMSRLKRLFFPTSFFRISVWKPLLQQ